MSLATVNSPRKVKFVEDLGAERVIDASKDDFVAQTLDWTKGREATAFDRSVDVMLSRLRRKLGDDSSAPRFIRTVRNGGYLFAANVSRG